MDTGAHTFCLFLPFMSWTLYAAWSSLLVAPPDYGYMWAEGKLSLYSFIPSFLPSL